MVNAQPTGDSCDLRLCVRYLVRSAGPVGENSGLTGFAWILLCAIIPWNFFAVVNNIGLTAITSNSGLVRRVAFPRETLVFSNVLFALVQFAIELVVLSGVLLIVAGAPILPWIPVAALLGILLAVFASGIGLALSALAVYFKDLTYLWAITLQVWFFITPVVYPPSVVEAITNVGSESAAGKSDGPFCWWFPRPSLPRTDGDLIRSGRCWRAHHQSCCGLVAVPSSFATSFLKV